MDEKTFEERYARLIRQKMNAGLTREGAIEVIQHQLENDARVAQKAKAKVKAPTTPAATGAATTAGAGAATTPEK